MAWRLGPGMLMRPIGCMQCMACAHRDLVHSWCEAGEVHQQHHQFPLIGAHRLHRLVGVDAVLHGFHIRDLPSGGSAERSDGEYKASPRQAQQQQQVAQSTFEAPSASTCALTAVPVAGGIEKEALFLNLLYASRRVSVPASSRKARHVCSRANRTAERLTRGITPVTTPVFRLVTTEGFIRSCMVRSGAVCVSA